MEEYLSMYKYKFKESFPLLEKNYPILQKIAPPMQNACAKLIELAKHNNYNRIIIFGSSTTWHFRNNSDLDICIDAELQIETIMKQVTEALDDVDFDLVVWKEISSLLLREEILKGVTIYDRSTDASRT